MREYLFWGTVDGKNTKMRVFAQSHTDVCSRVRQETGARSVSVTKITEV